MLLKTVRPNLFALFYIAVLRYCICGPVGDTSYHVGSNWEIMSQMPYKNNLNSKSSRLHFCHIFQYKMMIIVWYVLFKLGIFFR